MIPSSNLTRADQTAVSEAPGAVGPLSTETLFWRARFLRESADLHHLPFLFWLVEVTRPQLVVEFGVGTGVSHFATCQSLDKLMPQARCEGVGVWEDGDVPKDLAEYNAQHYAEFSSLRSGDPKADIGRYDDKSIDILHVSQPADSTLLSCLRYDWRHKMSSQGVVVLHGLTSNFGSDEAREFIRDLERSFPTIRLENGDGLIAVLYGSRRNPQLEKMAESSADKKSFSRLHDALARLGLLHLYEWRYIDQSEKIAKLRAEHLENESLRQEKDEQSAELSLRVQELEATHEQSSRLLSDLQSKAFDHQTALLDAKQSHLELQSRYDESLRDLDAKNQKIEQLQQSLSAMQTYTEQYRLEFETQEARLLNRITELERKLNDQVNEPSRTQLEENLEGALNESRKRASQLLEERSDTADQISTQASKIEDLEISNRLLTQEKDDLDQELLSAQEKIRQLESSLELRESDFQTLLNAIEAQEEAALLQSGNLKSELAERNEEISRLREELHLNENVRDEILNSTSWKLTAPARAVLNRLRGHSE